MGSSNQFLSYLIQLSYLSWWSFLAHASDIDDLLEGLDGVLEDWLDGLHDTESSLHIVDLWLHSLDGLHLSGDLNEWLSIIESLEDSSGKGLLDVLDGSGLGKINLVLTNYIFSAMFEIIINGFKWNFDFALGSTIKSERGDGLEESAISSFSLVMLSLDLGLLDSVLLIKMLQSILIFSFMKLILFIGNSILIIFGVIFVIIS